MALGDISLFGLGGQCCRRLVSYMSRRYYVGACIGKLSASQNKFYFLNFDYTASGIRENIGGPLNPIIRIVPDQFYSVRWPLIQTSDSYGAASVIQATAYIGPQIITRLKELMVPLITSERKRYRFSCTVNIDTVVGFALDATVDSDVLEVRMTMTFTGGYNDSQHPATLVYDWTNHMSALRMSKVLTADLHMIQSPYQTIPYQYNASPVHRTTDPSFAWLASLEDNESPPPPIGGVDMWNDWDFETYPRILVWEQRLRYSLAALHALANPDPNFILPGFPPMASISFLFVPGRHGLQTKKYSTYETPQDDVLRCDTISVTCPGGVYRVAVPEENDRRSVWVPNTPCE